MKLAIARWTLVSLLASTAVANAQPNESTVNRQAIALFQTGKGLYDQRRFQEAIEQFRASNELYASPNNLLYVGRCQRELGRLPDAWRSYQAARALIDPHDPDRYKRTVEAIQQEIPALEQRLARIRILADTLPPNAVVKINDEVVSNPTAENPVIPGEVVIRVEAPGSPPNVVTVTLHPGDVLSARPQRANSTTPNTTPDSSGPPPLQIRSDMTPTAQSGLSYQIEPAQSTVAPTVVANPNNLRPEPNLFLPVGGIALGVGGAMLLVGTITGASANDLYTRLTAECSDNGGVRYCSQRSVDDVRAQTALGQGLVTTTNVMLIPGAVALATGIVVGSIGLIKGARPTMVVTPTISANEIGLTWGGRF